MKKSGSLKRSLSLFVLTIYGLGTIVGGGFYALTGEVARHAGMHTPVAFLMAATVALFSALSFGELAARFPQAGGEAHYVLEAFGRPRFSMLVGLLVVTTGVVSAATLANAFVGFLQELVAVPTWAGIVAIVLVLGGVAAWGILESAILAAVITFIEVGALAYVSFALRAHIFELPARIDEIVPPMTLEAWNGIAVGAFLAFYSFIGFEDMVNLAEEVKDVRRTLPRGILLVLGLAALIYGTVTTLAVLARTPEAFAGSRSPLATVLGGVDAVPGVGITFVGMLAGLNGALVQVIMASRVLYGMGKKKTGPAVFARVSERTRTPVAATLLVTAVVLALALGFPLVTLARWTSSVILVVFTLVNVSLVVLKWREGSRRQDVTTYPIGVPIVGAAVSLLFLVFQI